MGHLMLMDGHVRTLEAKIVCGLSDFQNQRLFPEKNHALFFFFVSGFFR